MSPLQVLFDQCRSEGRSALLPFMTAGLPTPGDSIGIFSAMAAAGADGFEVGIPYADPLMDGPVIQKGSDTALAAGTTIETALGIISQVAELGKPVLAMTYANPVFRRGVDWFCRAAAEAGASGLIVADLPVEESDSIRVAARRHGIGLVQFVAPTSDRARIEAVVATDPIFVYAVAEMGVTGERSDGGGRLAGLIERVREVSQVPIVAGVGISTAEQVRAASQAGADGVIVGSALVRRVLEAAGVEEAAAGVASLVGDLRLQGR